MRSMWCIKRSHDLRSGRIAVSEDGDKKWTLQDSGKRTAREKEGVIQPDLDLQGKISTNR